ncbi:MAG: hypothetical protein GYB26_05580 [Gammaproteobacteria bacterium]|uniref:Uncharacterized protein n=1 Tax=Marinobacter litoralis TaxID=187981 RepID=A0A3M2RKY3_9GAMM|nr:DUF6586 family protein [Marinobacter litoralis]MBR9870591.1 hypothetical protein [Gammaproteobacteria bacterium]RMJ05839.1 hypothetical protein DOQ08_00515 [Marinobacter litoralis]
MASQWYSLTSQKLYLAKILLEQLEQPIEQAQINPKSTILNEAVIQGVIELMLRARGTLVVMIAQHHQQKISEPLPLEELKTRIPYETQDLEDLDMLQSSPTSWWNHLAELEKTLKQPPTPKKTVSADNIIAVSVEDVADRSAKGLQNTLTAMTNFARAVEDRHNEW